MNRRAEPQPSPHSALWLCGGGTGGHVYPALAVAGAIGSADPQRPLRYIGGVGGMEERIVRAESALSFTAVPAAAIRGRNPLALLRSLATMLQGVAKSVRLIDAEHPAAILGTGGYVCVPIFLAARIRNVPTMIYLPDVVPGLAVRFLSRIATLTAVNVEDALPRLGLHRDHPRAVVTGYPVRRALFNPDRAACRQAFGLTADLPVLLVYGGSRGARSINRAIAALLPDILPFAQVLHVCGREGDVTWLREAAEAVAPELQARYRLYEYLESGEEATATGTMIQAFGAADLAVCRSGASTLAELPAAGLAAVLVPYPYVHQDENADYLVRRAAAVKVADATMLGTTQPQAGPLFQQIRRLIDERDERQQMAERCRALARPNAADDLAAALTRLAGL